MENISIFDMVEEGKTAINNKLDVVKAEYIQVKSMTWQELFEGYDDLKAITYSSGIGFIATLAEKFNTVEIIFGCENIIQGKIHEIFAFQSKVIDVIRNVVTKSQQKILDRVDRGEVRLFVARNRLSHEKIYLLRSNNGKKRVIMGSANMSYNAFNGLQRENICYMDGNDAYDWYDNVYRTLRDESTDEITKKAIDFADIDENIDLLPISKTIERKKVEIIEPIKSNIENIEFVIDVNTLAKKIESFVPKQDKLTGKILISTDHIVKIKRQIIDNNKREHELRSEYPRLCVDVSKKTVNLNGSDLDLNPPKVDIRKDIELFLDYMEGYNKFHGNYAEMQFRYYEFANWFFCSPFMAVMRDHASKYDQNKLPYPVFGLLYGKSKAGKTSFLETLLKMMIGQKPKISAPDFTRSTIESLKHEIKGAPIIVDDLTNTRFNQHAIETIKNDDFGIVEHDVNYPAVVISANEDVKAVAPEVIRRTVICRVEAGLTNTEVMKSRIVRITQQKIGTAFYREYLRRMLEKIPDLFYEMSQEEAECAPDILHTSSIILYEIFNEYNNNLPEYIRELSLEDYFSEFVTGKKAIEMIKHAWKINRKEFRIDNKNNELRYNAGATYEAERIIKELPETLEARKSREWIVMNLDEAKTFFSINFKKNFFFN